MERQQSRAARILGCAVLLLLCYILESSLGLKIAVFGAHFDVLPAIVASAAVFLGCPAGLVCGLFAGMLYDAAGWPVQGLLPLYFMLWGIVGGFAGEHYRRRPLLSVVTLTVSMSALLSVIRYLFYFQFTTDIRLLTFVLHVLLQTVLCVVLCPLVFVFIRRIAGQQPKRMKKLPRGRRRRRRKNSNG